MTREGPGCGRGLDPDYISKRRPTMNMFNTARCQKVLRRMGTATFAFFLVKGLLWIAAPFIFLLAT
jgi:hypothetical protein